MYAGKLIPLVKLSKNIFWFFPSLSSLESFNTCAIEFEYWSNTFQLQIKWQNSTRATFNHSYGIPHGTEPASFRILQYIVGVCAHNNLNKSQNNLQKLVV